MKFLFGCLLVLTTSCSLFERREEPPTREEEVPQSEVVATTEPVPSAIASSSEVASAPQTQSILEKGSAVAPEVGLRYLRNGNTRFIKGTFRKDGYSKKDIQRVSNKEPAHSLVFSSSDSRFPPEIIFDQKLGEIYVIRTLDMSLDASVIGSIEYAVMTAGIRNIVVLGTSESVVAIANEIPKKLGAVAARLATGDIKITPAVYNLNTGKVDFK